MTRPVLMVIAGGRPAWKPYPPRRRLRWVSDRSDLAALEVEWRAMGIGPALIARMRAWVSEIHGVPHLVVLSGRKRA